MLSRKVKASSKDVEMNFEENLQLNKYASSTSLRT